VTLTNSSDPTYRVLLAASEADPAEPLHRLAMADWIDENTALHAQAAALRATGDARVEYAELEPIGPPASIRGHQWSVRRYHTDARDSYSWVGIYPTLKDAVAACYHWHLRGEKDVQCDGCHGSDLVSTDTATWGQTTKALCDRCDGSGWVPRCRADGCNEPGDPFGELIDDGTEVSREYPPEYYCPRHAADAGYCRGCRCPIEADVMGELCGECAWQARSEAMAEDFYYGPESDYDHHEDLS